YDLRQAQGRDGWAGEGLSITPGDVDWFLFSLAAPAVRGHTLAIQFRHASGDLDLELYDAGGTLLRSSATTSDGESISLAGLDAGNYYARVSGYNGQSNPSYSL